MFPSPVASRDEGKVYRIATGASGKLLALVMDTVDGEVRLFDAATLAPRGRVLLGAMRTVRAVALDPSDATLCVLTHDDATLFDLDEAKARWTVPLAGDEPSVAFSPDGARIAVGRAQGAVAVLATADGASVHDAPLGCEPRAILWDDEGMVMLCGREVVFAGSDGEPRATVSRRDPTHEPTELAAMPGGRFAVAGSSPRAAWVEVRARSDGRVRSHMAVEGDRRAEGAAFAGSVLFLATEGGTYRADAPYEQLVRWLPPMGGAHDPTRLACVADEHVAVVARDVRVFRTRS